jgi:hypothetical protein
MLEDHVNAVLSAPIEDQPAQFMADVAPVLTAATVYTSSQVAIVASSMTMVTIAG